ncbi:hypothetical protein AVEN_9848-1 [Araneus ventricosus]|uniref:Tesmin/TSO1-like CXC domain-containing protein n=1 Tax=Araneus ventricosus TaxID=182803 RepID=A0A4Y2EGF1_ARAVE|nr:hypothetical protein AVEN_9848-1 [Araneus ventricosus]
MKETRCRNGLDKRKILFSGADLPDSASPHAKWKGKNPESLLKIISCNCKKGCKNACGCRKAGLICSSLYTCSLGEACENVSDINLLEDSIEDEDDTPSSINNFIYEDIEDLYLQLDEEDKEQ